MKRRRQPPIYPVHPERHGKYQYAGEAHDGSRALPANLDPLILHCLFLNDAPDSLCYASYGFTRNRTCTASANVIADWTDTPLSLYRCATTDRLARVMPEKLFNSPVQHALVTVYRFVSARLNLHGTVLGKSYRRLYFTYKNIVDRHLLATARKLAKPDTLVVDVGANIGFFSVALARHANVSVLAFEPDQQNYQTLSKVAAERRLAGRIHPFMLALSDKTGTGSLYLSDLAPTDHKLINSRSSRAVEIEIARLDDFLARHPDLAKTSVSLIKIDVQGAELLVLRGMQQTLAANSHPPILIEYSPDDLIHAGATPREFFDAFLALGYVPHTLPGLVARDPDWFIENTHGAYRDLAMIHSPSP